MPPTTKPTQHRLASRLVEKAAVHFAMWQLARRGCEPLITTENCNHGDIWVRLVTGQILRVEVKGSSEGQSWTIRSKQLDGADIYIFVSIHDGRSWIMPTASLRENLKIQSKGPEGTYTVTAGRLPDEFYGGWSRIGELEIAPKAITQDSMPPNHPAERRADRVVRRVLADGSLKEYHYPSWKRPPKRQIDRVDPRIMNS